MFYLHPRILFFCASTSSALWILIIMLFLSNLRISESFGRLESQALSAASSGLVFISFFFQIHKLKL